MKDDDLISKENIKNIRKGDILICVFTNYSLTLFKKYVVHDIYENADSVSILNDENRYLRYGMFNFLTLKEFRLLKLKQMI